MTDLAPLLPLGGTHAQVDVIGALRIVENADAAFASVSTRHGQDTALAAAAPDIFGVPLPGPGQSANDNDFSIWWTGTNQWMVAADHTSHETLATTLATQFHGIASVTEQTDGWCRFEISGTGSEELFERLCALDIRAMHPGAANRTGIHHLGCFVIRATSGDAYFVLGPRSSAGSLHHALVAAAQSIA